MMQKFYTSVACQGNYIYYRGVEDGRRVRRKMEYAPTLFMHSNAPTVPGREYWKDLKGNPIDVLDFPSISEAREFLKTYEDVENFSVHGNNKFEYTFIAEQHPEEQMEWTNESIVTAFIDIEVSTVGGMPNVETCRNPITAITVKFSNDPLYYVLGCKSYTPHQKNIDWKQCADETDLIESFMDIWRDKSPDIITGWNVKTFDIPYLVGRMVGLPAFGEEKARWLSPWGRISRREETFYNKPHTVFQILGVATLDYLQLYRKYAPKSNQESYKLDHIAHVELKERKVNYSEYDTLHHMYSVDFQKFMEYNIRDVELVEKLNAKGRLIDMAILLAYDNKTNYEDVFSQVRMWDAICYNHLNRKGVVIPPKKHATKSQAYQGAYVKAPLIGMFRWLLGEDLTSLYPHLIMQYNMSPETLIDPADYTDVMRELVRKGVSVNALLNKELDLSGLVGCTLAPNGQFFDTTKVGFLPEIMQKMFNDRVVYKNKQIEAEKEKEACIDPARKLILESLISRYKNLQLAKKVGLNSAYGALGNEFFRFFDVRIAEGITLAGQLSIRWIENKINEYMNKLMKTKMVDYVVASDTDSVYINFAPLVDKVFQGKYDTQRIVNFIDGVAKKDLNPFIEMSYQELADYTHAYAQKMNMKREAIADKGIWTAKKRYVLNVLDNEGVRYREPDMVIHGLEAIKSSTPSICRDKIKEALKIILTGTEPQLIEFVKTFKKEFNTLPLSDIAFPRGCNGLEKYRNKTGVAEVTQPTFMGYYEGPQVGSAIYITRTPIHVKGALIYNYFLKYMNLDTQYETIQDGEKVKFLHLKPGNMFEDTVISFVRRIPPEFEIEKHIDYNKQFDKTFHEPLNIVLSAIGWNSEAKSSLEGLFK